VPVLVDWRAMILLRTARTSLRPWRKADASAFAALHADAEVMRDLGGPLSRSQSDDKLHRYLAAFAEHGFCRWAVDDLDGDFIGYAGVMPIPAHYPVAPGFEIGWRFVRSAWGKGLAFEAAAAALKDVFVRTELTEVLSFTAPDNVRSQALMRRLELRRDEDRDFTVDCDGVAWRGLVWVAERHDLPRRQSSGAALT
jgi:RimJ/RimL family protein N-acetyltransferase